VISDLLFIKQKRKEKKMDINSFIENFAGQFDDTPADQITPETVFADLEEWSSLTALSIIAMVDEEYGVTLKGDDIKNATTVQDIFNTVSSKK
jgi:acyl carrier protein